MSHRVVTRKAPDKRKTGGAGGQARSDTRSRSPVLRTPDGPGTKVRQSEKGESCLEGVNRQNLKILGFEHAICPGLVLEIIRSVEDSPLARSCSINADNFGSQLKSI
jgi:hypothetical protein